MTQAGRLAAIIIVSGNNNRHDGTCKQSQTEQLAFGDSAHSTATIDAPFGTVVVTLTPNNGAVRMNDVERRE